MNAALSNPFGLMATPALDLAPSGHLPFIVEQARSHPDADGAREHTAEHLQDDDVVLALVDEETVDMAKLAALANDPARLTVSDVWAAIEAVFAASKNPKMTSQALREFVDMTAAKAVRR